MERLEGGGWPSSRRSPPWDRPPGGRPADSPGWRRARGRIRVASHGLEGPDAIEPRPAAVAGSITDSPLPTIHDMVTHMKTTVDISRDILDRAKKIAVEEGTTLRSLIEEGLRWVLARRGRPAHFRLKDRSVPGNGVAPGVTEGSWEQLRDLIYPGRGA